MVVIDVGAPLWCEGLESPVMCIAKLHSKICIQFDHIDVFEITKQDPAKVHKRVPDEL